MSNLPSIILLMPTRGLIFTKAIEALDRELREFPHARAYTTDLPLPDCRNKLIEIAKSQQLYPFDYYLLMDDDVIIPNGGLKAMLKLDADVAFIDYPAHFLGKNEGLGTAAYKIWKEGMKPEECEVEWGGLGCVLTKAEVFKRISPPYFRKGGRLYERDKNGQVVYYGESGGDGGEDFEFFQDCKKLGMSIKQVPNMVAGHAKVMRHIGIVESGKYVKQHEIHIANEIKKPWK